MENFGDWILKQLNAQGWSQAELARRAHISQPSLSRIISGTQGAGPDVCLAIARALKEPPEKVFRLAGILPTLPQDTAQEKELVGHFRYLNGDGRREAIAIVKALREAKETYSP